MAISTIGVLQARALWHRFAAPVATSIWMNLASLENDFGKCFLHRQREFSGHSRFALVHQVVASVSICVRHTGKVVITHLYSDHVNFVFAALAPRRPQRFIGSIPRTERQSRLENVQRHTLRNVGDIACHGQIVWSVRRRKILDRKIYGPCKFFRR